MEKDDHVSPNSLSVPESLDVRPLSLPEAFSCIALLDSRRHDVPFDKLHHAIAISSTDSLYVSTSLLSDPWNQQESQDIVHIEGNIGRPGISFLVPPPAPVIKEVKITEWPQTTYEVFDGCLDDRFGSTSLHLRFTDDVSGIDVGPSLCKDSMVYLVEALISLHDHKYWVADLDVNKSLQRASLRRVRSYTDSGHSAGGEPQLF